jgi:hypothetical protein
MKKVRPLLRIFAVLTVTLPVLTLSVRALDKQTDLHKFNRKEGYTPYFGLLRDGSGNLYGVTANGNSGVFELSPASGGGWTFNTIFTFVGGQYGPVGPLVMDTNGNLYGATDNYGSAGGVVYELSPAASGTWTQTVLDTQEIIGGGPSAVVLDGAGNLYGAVSIGGANNVGYVFELSPSADGQWNFQDIYDFSGTPGQYYPAGVTFDSHGNLFGTLQTFRLLAPAVLANAE